jgi:hypothetical protein
LPARAVIVDPRDELAQTLGLLDWRQGAFAGGARLLSGSSDATALIWDVSEHLNAKTTALPPTELDRCWDDLGGTDAVRAYRAVRRLTKSPSEAVGFLRGHLQPAAAADVKRFASLIAGLDSDAFAEREKAMRELERHAGQAEPLLRKALEAGPSPEVRRRIETLLSKLQGPVTSTESRAKRKRHFNDCSANQFVTLQPVSTGRLAPPFA